MRPRATLEIDLYQAEYLWRNVINGMPKTRSEIGARKALELLNDLESAIDSLRLKEEEAAL